MSLSRCDVFKYIIETDRVSLVVRKELRRILDLLCPSYNFSNPTLLDLTRNPQGAYICFFPQLRGRSPYYSNSTPLITNMISIVHSLPGPMFYFMANQVVVQLY